MESRWIYLLLGKDGSHTRGGSIYFHNERSFWIRMRACVKDVLNFSKASLAAMDQERDLGLLRSKFVSGLVRVL